MREIINTGVKINEIENRKRTEKNQLPKSLFFEGIEKTDKHLARITKKGDTTQVTRIRNDSGDITGPSENKDYEGVLLTIVSINKTTQLKRSNSWNYTNYLTCLQKKDNMSKLVTN